ncbi:MAG: hypothetical protein HKM06_05135, partial [Spirochaetales bacterium]|nr:hypothetical protein [Spirochaetales bacterium]
MRFKLYRSLAVLVLFLSLGVPLFARPTPILRGLDYATSFEILPGGHFLISEKKGLILEATPEGKVSTWADLTSSTYDVGDAGLLSLALDPHFAENGYVYASQTADVNGKKSYRLIRLKQENGQGVLDKILWDGLPAVTKEVGGIVRYGPDGCLYWGVGAGGDGKAAQDPTSLRGALLRLYPDGTIPSDNPFPGSPEWAWGLRDPRGMTWNPDNGHLYGLDRGAKVVDGTLDELNLREP